MIVKELKAAMHRKGWSITQTASESGLDRTFVGRVLSAKTPPRSRSGRRTAEYDERYHKLATALDLDPDHFVREVVRLQSGVTSAQAPSPKLFAEPLVRHFNRLCVSYWHRIRDSIPPADKAGFLSIADTFFTAPAIPGVVGRLENAIAGLPARPQARFAFRGQPLSTTREYLGFRRRDYLGTLPAPATAWSSWTIPRPSGSVWRWRAFSSGSRAARS